MLLSSKKPRRRRAGLRDLMRTARDTYREYSGTNGSASLPARRDERPRAPLARADDPDVLLDVPTLKVDEIDLELDELQARVALDARVLDLLKLDVGVDASLGRVQLQIKGVEAEAHLRVRLDNLAVILNRVMDTIDNNPQILERLTGGIGDAVGEIGRGAGSAVEDVGGAAGDIARRVAPD